jgi:AraC-like DNA-binding protein
MVLHQAVYTALALNRFREHRHESARWGIHRFWVPCLVFVVVLQHAAQLLRLSFRHEPILRDVVPVTGAACFVVVTLIGLRKALPFVARSGSRYATSTLAPARAQEAAEQLRAIMERDRPHLRPDLTLDDLAGILGVPKTHLSQILNETLGQSFLDFLTGYRIRESERLLRDEGTRHLTIEAVGRDSGFRSRSAFYEAFRKAHGATPAEYRRRASEG